MSGSEALRAGDVGPYGELIRRPNPDGLEVVTVPTFEDVLPFLEQQAGRARRRRKWKRRGYAHRRLY